MEENKKVIGSVVLESGNIKHIYAVQSSHINTKILSVAKKYEQPHMYKVSYKLGKNLEEIEGTFVKATKDLNDDKVSNEIMLLLFGILLQNHCRKILCLVCHL